MTSYQRKRILIDPTAQLALARGIALDWCRFLGLMVLLAVCMEIIVQHPDQSLASISRGVFHRHAQTVTLMLLALPFFVYRSIKFSHRFAGPIWRLRRELRRLREGYLVPPIHFRKDDFWQDLADDINWILVRLEQAEKGHADSSERLDGDPLRPPPVPIDLAGE